MRSGSGGTGERIARQLAALARRHALRSSLYAAALVAGGELLFAALDRSWGAPGVLVGLRLAHACLALVLLAALARWRQRFRLLHGDLALVLLGLPFLAIFWIAEEAVAARGEPWAPFSGAKLIAVALALLTPGRLWLGGLFVALFVAEALLLWHVAGIGEHTALVAAGEPWVTLFFGVVALVLLGYRARTRRVEREFLRARVQAESLEALARIFLAVRDRANTPLQTLELGVAVLEKRHPEAAPIAARMSRALARLRRLTDLLARQQVPSEWEPAARAPELEELLGPPDEGR